MESAWLHRPGDGMEALSFRWKGRVQASSWQWADGVFAAVEGRQRLDGGEKNIVPGLSRRRVIPMLLEWHVVSAEGQRFVAEAPPRRRCPGGGAEAAS